LLNVYCKRFYSSQVLLIQVASKSSYQLVSSHLINWLAAKINILFLVCKRKKSYFAECNPKKIVFLRNVIQKKVLFLRNAIVKKQMEKIIQLFRSQLKRIDLQFKRYLLGQINWQQRLIVITGARGVGKTTLLLQYIKQNFSQNLDTVLYVSMDNLYFGKNTLSDFTDEFVKFGGKILFLDEIHKYPNWSQEIKNIYDNYPELQLVLTGSAAINIYKGKGDLSRRMVLYKMNGLSFREFLNFKYGFTFSAFTLSELLQNATKISEELNAEIKPLKYFEQYLKKGYYPFFAEDTENYYQRIEQTVNQVIEGDLPSIEHINYTAVYNLRKLLSVISELVPFKPNVSQLSKQLGIDRETFIKYLQWLHKAELLLLLQTNKFGLNKLNKPEKIFLNNTNLLYALCENNPNTGTLRETFFYNQLKEKHSVQYTEQGDFLIDSFYTFEIGGKNKTNKQITDIPNAFIAADNIEYAYKNTIPLWIFGFLY